MNLLVEKIVDKNTLDKSVNEHAKRDKVVLNWYEADRRVMRKTTQSGQDIAFRLLGEGQRLCHGDVVYADDKTVIEIEIEPCAVIVISPQTLPDMARACYEIGNKHSPLFLDGDELLMPYDKPMFEWLSVAGFAPTQDTRRLSQMLRANSAQGVGAGGHSHAHSHNHSHDHAHSHSHDHIHSHHHSHDHTHNDGHHE